MNFCWPGTHYVDKVGLKLIGFPSAGIISMCYQSVYTVLGIKPRTPCTDSKHSANGALVPAPPQPPLLSCSFCLSLLLDFWRLQQGKMCSSGWCSGPRVPEVSSWRVSTDFCPVTKSSVTCSRAAVAARAFKTPQLPCPDYRI